MVITFLIIGMLVFIALVGKINLIIQFNNEVMELFSQSKSISDKTFIYKQLDCLPEPVQRYFKHVLKEGQSYISYVRLTDSLIRVKIGLILKVSNILRPNSTTARCMFKRFQGIFKRIEVYIQKIPRHIQENQGVYSTDFKAYSRESRCIFNRFQGIFKRIKVYIQQISRHIQENQGVYSTDSKAYSKESKCIFNRFQGIFKRSKVCIQQIPRHIQKN